MKLNSYLLKASIVGALGGLLFGFDTAVIAGTTALTTQGFQPLRLVEGNYSFDCAVGNGRWRAERRLDRSTLGWT